MQVSETKAKMIEAAIDVYAELGVSNTTIAHIAKKAGSSVSQVAYHFGNAKNIFPDVMNYAFIGSQEYFNRSTDARPTTQTPFEAYIMAYFRWGHQYPKYRNLFLYFFYSTSFDVNLDKMNRLFMDQIKRKIESYLYEYAAKNNLNVADATESANFIVKSLIGNILFIFFEKSESSWKRHSKEFLDAINHYLAK